MKNLYHSIIHLLLFTVTINIYAQTGQNIFDDSYIHIIEINSIEPLSYQNFHDTLYNSMEDIYYYTSMEKDYHKASVIIDGTKLDTIGVRYKGFSTFEYAKDKYSLKIDFNEFVKGQSYDNLKKINLHNHIGDPTCMRTKLSNEVMQRLGVPAPRVAYAKVYVNNNYRGIYSMVEQIDKTFLKHNYTNTDSIGYLHKAWGLTIGYPTATFSGQDTTDEILARRIPLKTRKSEANYEPMKVFIDAVNNLPEDEFEMGLDAIFNTELFIKQTAASVIMDDRDHYCFSGQNFYMYLYPETNRWEMIPWDQSLAFGVVPVFEEVANNPFFSRQDCLLTDRMMVQNEGYKTQYKEALCEILNIGLDSTWINNRIIELSDLLRDELYFDDHHYCDGADFEQYLDDTYIVPEGNPLDGFETQPLRTFINERDKLVREQLMIEGFNCQDNGSDDYVINSNNDSNNNNDYNDDNNENNNMVGVIELSNDLSIAISPNPTSGRLNIQTDKTVNNIVVIDLMGKIVKTNDANEFIDITELKAGVYTLLIWFDDFEIPSIKRVVKI